MSPDCKVIILPKDEIDKANKDKKKHYPSNFQVGNLYYGFEVFFSRMHMGNKVLTVSGVIDGEQVTLGDIWDSLRSSLPDSILSI